MKFKGGEQRKDPDKERERGGNAPPTGPGSGGLEGIRGARPARWPGVRFSISTFKQPPNLSELRANPGNSVGAITSGTGGAPVEQAEAEPWSQGADWPDTEHAATGSNVMARTRGKVDRARFTPAAPNSLQMYPKPPDGRPWLLTKNYEISPPGGSGGELVGDLEVMAEFTLASIIIHNMTTLWAYIPSAQDFVPPNTVGWIARCYTRTQKLHVRWLAPGGHAQPAPVAGQFAIIRGAEEPLPPTTGTGSPIG